MTDKDKIEQLLEILADNNIQVLNVRDGFVGENDEVYWHSEDGPVLVLVNHHMANIKICPQFYSINKPKVKIQYIYD